MRDLPGEGIGHFMAVSLNPRAERLLARLPLGTLMGLAAWPIWLIHDQIYSGGVQTILL